MGFIDHVKIYQYTGLFENDGTIEARITNHDDDLDIAVNSGIVRFDETEMELYLHTDEGLIIIETGGGIARVVDRYGRLYWYAVSTKYMPHNERRDVK